MDMTYIVGTLISAVFGTSVSMIVQYMSNRHTLKMREFELFTENRLKYIEQYTEAVTESISRRYSSPAFEKCSCAIDMFVPEECVPITNEIRLCILARDYQKAEDALQRFCTMNRLYKPACKGKQRSNHKHFKQDTHK